MKPQRDWGRLAARGGKHRRLLSRLLPMQSYDVCARTCAAGRWAALRRGVSPSSGQERGTRGCLASPRRAGTSPAGAEAAGGERLGSPSRRGATGPATCLVHPSDGVEISGLIGRSRVTSVRLGAPGRAEPEPGPEGSGAGHVSGVASGRLLFGCPGGVCV